MSIDIAWLEKHVLKRQLSADGRSALECIKTSSFTTGQTILSQGQSGGMLYILRSGKASVEDNKSGNRMHLADISEGDCFGALTFLNSEPVNADVLAQQPCEVYSLSHKDFSEFMHNQQDIAYAIFEYMLEHQSEVIRSLRGTLLPILRKLKEKAESLPLFIKLFPVVFVIIYILAFFYISWKDFSY